MDLKDLHQVPFYFISISIMYPYTRENILHSLITTLLLIFKISLRKTFKEEAELNDSMRMSFLGPASLLSR